MASLQNSAPVQAIVPRTNGEASVRSPASRSSRATASAWRSGTCGISRFCMIVVRSSPAPKQSARFAAARSCADEMRPRSTAAPT